MQQVGKYIIIGGVILVIIGVLVFFLGDKFSWLGRLPGDIRIEKENFSFYFPITTMILVSIIISLVFYLVNKFF